MNVAVKFLNFKISYTWLVGSVAIDEYFTPIKAHFVGSLIKITQILSILQGL